MKRTPLTRKTPLRAKPLPGILRTANLQPAAPTFAAKPRMRKCEVCRTPFQKLRMGQTVCGPTCALQLAKLQRQKAERAEDRARKEAIKTRSDWMKEAQQAFNAFIRARDAGKPCICCGRPLKGHDSLNGHNIDAGHFRSVGSAPHLRFDERNCHAQLVACNRYGAGRAVDYRIGLIARIGLEAVEALEADQTPRKWTIDELKAIKATYKAKLKELLAHGRRSQ